MTMSRDDMPGQLAEEVYRQDLSYALIQQMAEWCARMGQRGVIVRGFTGVTDTRRQMVIALSNLNLNHIQERDLMIWLCREERITTYVYASRFQEKGDPDSEAREILSLQASSEQFNATVDFTVHRNGQSHSFRRERLHAFEAKNAEDQFLFHGLQRKQHEIGKAENASYAGDDFYAGIWQRLKGRCLWRDLSGRA
jgi:hypothetical protein